MANVRASAWTSGRAPVAAQWVARLRGAELPGEVTVLIVIGLVATTGCLLAAQFPISGQTPATLLRACAGGAALLSVALFAAGPWLPRIAVHGTLVAFVVGATVLTANAHTNGGLMLIARSFPWFAAYAALFLSPRAARLHAVVITIGCALAIAIADLPGTRVEAVMVSVTVWTVAIVLSALSERLREQADTDHLTGLLNRNGFTKAATREHALAARTGAPLALAVLDLDGFKVVNDEQGHAAGDRLLAELARAWEDTVRPGDVLARFGGDEFLVMFPATSAADAGEALARLRAAHAVGWSAGVAEWQRGESLAACLARADRHLYEAKASGSGAVAGVTPAPAPQLASVRRRRRA